eukprot:TRINITY_DN521_c0_g1_i1.p1 TRINITY_DN521_c0_g1~~TRINITY_DN521_c0_g1_i1.p1  ORF type:complete len:107 (-),score=28.42 TRINITY_DN521_c0_g1_i1:72-392(-)
MYKLIVLCCLLGLAMASQPKKAKSEPACTICVDVMTDLTTWVTSDTTEEEIVSIMKNLCAVLGYILADLEASCNAIFDEQFPAIIDQIVNDNFNPQEICNAIGACN